ncbi:acyltransferase family protein [Geodermatophilus chilensis]|uniref:acyltransferase family protein n=1 Tax=Geodermatophilus chilensis TaxID=2035835 RepID=UPI000C261FF3|nr:acyltransferase family protein [Geodermatophilus chilensis]
MADAEERRGFRPDVEGLRAVAVLAVVLYHVEVPGFPGGFVGVDVFFVVSGFLITGLLWREVEDTGSVRLARFYGARARRLLPAAVTVLVVVAVACAWLLPPLQARSVLGDVLASAIYAGNYRFALSGTDYLAADEPSSPVQHYWSLGVEEQFYLLWPALLIIVAGTAGLVSSRARRRRAAQERRSVVPLLVVLAAVAAASFALSVHWTRTAPPWAFFSLPARAWELAVGGLVTLTVSWWRRLPPAVARLAGWTGLALVVLSCARLGASTAFPGPAALAPVLGAALVVGAGCALPRGGVGAALSVAPMRLIGRCSYSWYLWHWPVLVLAPFLLGHPLGLGGRLAAAALSGGLAVLTLHAVENPLRFAATLRRSAGRSLLLGGGVTAAGVAAVLVVLSVVPVPVGPGVAARAPGIGDPEPPESGVPASSTSPTLPPEQAAVQALTAQVQAAVAGSVEIQAVPSNLTPPLAGAAADRPAPFRDGCVLTWTAVGVDTCTYGATEARTTVTLIGDSHAAQWEPALEQVAQQRQWRLETLGKVTCPLLDLPITSPYLGRRYTECEQWRSQVLDRIHADPPAVVVLGMTRRYGLDFGFTVYGPQWLDSLTRTVADLRATGAVVLVLGPVPDPLTNVPRCLSGHLTSAAACAPDRTRAVNDGGIAAEAAATAAGGGHYADLTSLFCTATRCPLIVGNQLVYRDDNHLTVGYAQWLTPVLAAAVDQAMAGR